MAKSKERKQDELADLVLRYRTRHKLSMKEFAEMCGVCWQTIWNLEHNNYKPQRTTRCAIEMILEEEVL